MNDVNKESPVESSSNHMQYILGSCLKTRVFTFLVELLVM